MRIYVNPTQWYLEPDEDLSKQEEDEFEFITELEEDEIHYTEKFIERE